VTTRTVRTTSGIVEFLEDGPADGTPVVLLHGFPDGPGTWDAVLSRLPAGLHTVRPSLRGVGGSVTDLEARSGQVAALASDVLDLLDALGLERVLLVGHDWGARAAHAVAALAPERLSGLVTLATAYGPRTDLDPQESLDDAAVAWYRYWLCTDAGAEAFRREPAALVTWAWRNWSPALDLPEPERAAMLRAFDTAEFAETVVHYYRHGAGAAAGLPRYAERQRVLDTWPAISVPTTFLVGTADGCETLPAARSSAGSFADPYEVVELDGVGHFVQREAPDAVAAAIRERL
jgi:pimeloyl-ACP methyl ester carboxylesterase